eukprot:UN29383
MSVTRKSGDHEVTLCLKEYYGTSNIDRFINLIFQHFQTCGNEQQSLDTVPGERTFYLNRAQQNYILNPTSNIKQLQDSSLCKISIVEKTSKCCLKGNLTVIKDAQRKIRDCIDFYDTIKNGKTKDGKPPYQALVASLVLGSIVLENTLWP